jgi:hypothetical protein
MLRITIATFFVGITIASAGTDGNYAHKLSHHGMKGSKGSDLCPTGNGCGYCEIDGKQKWVNVAGPFVQSCLECKVEPDCLMICRCKDLTLEEPDEKSADGKGAEADIAEFTVVETTYDLNDGCRTLGNDGSGHLYCYNHQNSGDFWTVKVKLLAFFAIVAVLYVVYLRQKRANAGASNTAAPATTSVAAATPVAVDPTKLPGSML